MKVSARTFWQDLKQSIKGLAELPVKRATIVMGGSNEPVLMHLEILVERRPEVRLLSKTYALVEVGTGETEAFLSENEDGVIEITDLSFESVTWVKSGGYS